MFLKFIYNLDIPDYVVTIPYFYNYNNILDFIDQLLVFNYIKLLRQPEGVYCPVR